MRPAAHDAEATPAITRAEAEKEALRGRPATPGNGCAVADFARAIPSAREVRGNGRKAQLEVSDHGRE